MDRRNMTSDAPDRHFTHFLEPVDRSGRPQGARELAKDYVNDRQSEFGITSFRLLLDDEPKTDSMDRSLGPELRFGNEKSFQNTRTISYVQTHFGVPVWQAGISIVVQNNSTPRRVTMSHSTIHHDANPQLDSPNRWYMPEGIDYSFPSLLGKYVNRNPTLAVNTSRNVLKINGARLWIYQYDHAARYANRGDDHIFSIEDGIRQTPPTLRLGDVPVTIRHGEHYVVTEVLFTLPLPRWGSLNWRAFVEVETGAILYLRAFVSGLDGRVFKFDPVTLSGDTTITPGASYVTLDKCIDDVTLPGVKSTFPSLTGDYVEIEDISGGPVLVALGGPAAPKRLNYSPRAEAKQFSVVSAYYHCDDAFRMFQRFGFTFTNSAKPVGVDPWASIGPDCQYADCSNAMTIGNAAGNGVQGFIFAQIDYIHFLSLATDKRAVLHEMGHALLYESIGSPNLGNLAHSVGDSLAAIHCDPPSQLTGDDRCATFPWISFTLGLSNSEMRRHDRSIEEGWGWSGNKLDQNYQSEQVLTTTLFRAYRAAGGDATHDDPKTQLLRRRQAADLLLTLIVGAVGALPPNSITPIDSPDIFASYLVHADLGLPKFVGRPGGTLRKVISWAFEKQGLVPSNGHMNTLGEGTPAVDVYIDDGRKGEYQFKDCFWNSRDIWNRRHQDGDTEYVHEIPEPGKPNYLYVRVHNRGSQLATNVEVSAYRLASEAGLTWPADLTTNTMHPKSITLSKPIPAGGERRRWSVSMDAGRRQARSVTRHRRGTG